MVLADSVELLHYPAIMFSSPSAPRLAPLPCPLAATNPTQTATTLHHSLFCPLPIHPFSAHLATTPAPPPPPLPPLCCYSSLSIHLQLPPCLFNSLSLSLSLSGCVSVSLSISLTPFCWSYCFFSVSCLPLSSFLPSFVNLLWFIGFTAVTFWHKLYFQNKTGFAKRVKQYFMHTNPIKMINYSIWIQGVWKIAHNGQYF